MGHFFRSLNLIDELKKRKLDYILLVNEHLPAIKHLEKLQINYQIIKTTGDWEISCIERFHIGVWINDRLDTSYSHAMNVINTGTKMVTFDDYGAGANLSELHIAALPFLNKTKPVGKKVLKGVNFLILSPEISAYRRLRQSYKNILVTMGGTDTYGVTIKVLKILDKLGKKATIILGPGFQHQEELSHYSSNKNFVIKQQVPSLIKEFSSFDCVICGGGLTPFEANATGLPCIIIANEDFEVGIGEALHANGSSIFAGHHNEIEELSFSKDLPIEQMSKKGMDTFDLKAVENIVDKIQELV